MTKPSNEAMNNIINIFLFDPRKTKHEYRLLYKKNCAGRFKKEKGYFRYSPIYILMKDIRFCFGVGKEFNSNRQSMEFPYFAGLLLIDIVLETIVEHTYNLPSKKELSKRREAINNHICKYLNSYCKLTPTQNYGFRILRNALAHNNYGLSMKYKGKKHSFSLSPSYSELIVKKNTNTKIEWYINPHKYFSMVQKLINDLRKQLLNSRYHHKRNYIHNNLDRDRWIVMKVPKN